MARFFIDGNEIANDNTKPVIDKNINDTEFLKEGNYFLETNDLANMPSNYRNTWVWVNTKAYPDADRVLQAMTPDNGNLGWMAFRTVATNDNIVRRSQWNLIDFVNGKSLQI
nr:MAG TPA: hypothetical protein [Caudoviricetes sp.]